MATYVDVPYNEIVIDEPSAGEVFLYNEITIPLPDAIMRRALVLDLLRGVVPIDDSSVGTGLKPIVFLNGVAVQRVDTEGTPIVVMPYGYKTLSVNEELII